MEAVAASSDFLNELQDSRMQNLKLQKQRRIDNSISEKQKVL